MNLQTSTNAEDGLETKLGRLKSGIGDGILTGVEREDVGQLILTFSNGFKLDVKDTGGCDCFDPDGSLSIDLTGSGRDLYDDFTGIVETVRDARVTDMRIEDHGSNLIMTLSSNLKLEITASGGCGGGKLYVNETRLY